MEIWRRSTALLRSGMRYWVLAALCACSCSGDDAHRAAVTTPTPTPVVQPDGAKVDTPATPDTPAKPDTKPDAPAALEEHMADPYFTGGDAGDGAQQFALHNYKNARDAFELALGGAKDDATKARLHLLAGLCDEELGDWKKASEHLAAAQDGLPVIHDYVLGQLANALEHASMHVEALDAARHVDKASIAGPDAEMLIGDILGNKGDWDEAEKHYADYLKRHPDGPHLSEARFRHGEALEHTGHKADAIALYRTVYIHDNLSNWATKADTRLAALGDSRKYDVADQITRAKVLFDGMRNPESEKAFDEALADKTITPDQKCDAAYHRAQSHFKARKYTESGPMFDEAVTACHDAKNTDLEVKSNYQAGRSYAYGKDPSVAAARYKAAGAVDPKHSYADDAMLREAEEYAVQGDDEKVRATLSELPKKFPDGDNSAEAMWRLGWRSWRAQKYDDAIKWWKEQIRLVPHDDSYIGEGEPQYWLGRAYAAKKDTKAAIAQWQECIRSYPAAYYALQALNRLRETSKKDYDAMVAEISADPKGFDPKAPAFQFKARPEWGSAGFARAMELLRLGLGEPAEMELHRLGLSIPHDKKKVDDPDKIEKLWAIAFLYDRAGRYASSHWPTRWHILDYRRSWPTGANRARWEIAYPKAYWELLSRHAKKNGVPIAMQIGIVREESAFDPLDESYANAIGLTQMIPETAHDFAKGTGIDPTREALRDPEKNVTIGSRFLGSLYKDWKDFTLLVPPSYNAGPGAVRKMLRVRGTWDSDEFVEGIVDDQARNYTKRVLGTYFTYSWLYFHEIPEIPNRIPTGLIPKKK